MTRSHPICISPPITWVSLSDHPLRTNNNTDFNCKNPGKNGTGSQIHLPSGHESENFQQIRAKHLGTRDQVPSLGSLHNSLDPDLSKWRLYCIYSNQQSMFSAAVPSPWSLVHIGLGESRRSHSQHERAACRYSSRTIAKTKRLIEARKPWIKELLDRTIIIPFLLSDAGVWLVLQSPTAL